MTIDLRSDTVTKPTAAMRRAMAAAEVGDDVLDGDPTVKRLEERTAELLGKERALFFPSGTMANQAAIWTLSKPGTEIYLDADAHIVHYEMAASAALSGVQIRIVRSATGALMRADDLSAAIRAPSSYSPSASVVCLENTHNGAGGRITPLAELRALKDVAVAHALPVHLDGARLWNASAASGTAPYEYAGCADTVMVSFSKGLGAPVGAALAGPASLIEAADAARKRFGGGMRQSGIIAAGALYGLQNHMDRLYEDHEHARLFANAVDGIRGATVVPPDTNIVMLDLPPELDAQSVVRAAAEQGILLSRWTPSRIRAVTHLDADAGAVLKAAEGLARVLEEA